MSDKKYPPVSFRWYRYLSEVQNELGDGKKNDIPRHISLDKVVKMVGRDDAYLYDLLLLTKESLSESLETLKKANADNNVDLMKKTGHKIKGTSLTMGLDVLAVYALDLQNFEGEESELQNLVNKVDAEILKIIEIIDLITSTETA